MRNTYLSKADINDNVLVNDYLIAKGCMFHTQEGGNRYFLVKRSEDDTKGVVLTVNMERNEWSCFHPEMHGRVTDLAEQVFSLELNTDTLQNIYSTAHRLDSVRKPSSVTFDRSRIQVPMDIGPVIDTDTLYPLFCMGLSAETVMPYVREGIYTGIKDKREHHTVMFPNNTGGYYSLDNNVWHTFGDDGITLIGPRRDNQRLCVFDSPLDFLALLQKRKNLGTYMFFPEERYLIINGQRNLDDALRHILNNSSYFEVCCFMPITDYGISVFRNISDISEGTAIDSSRLYTGYDSLADTLDFEQRATREEQVMRMTPQKTIARKVEKPQNIDRNRQPSAEVKKPTGKSADVTLDTETRNQGFRL